MGIRHVMVLVVTGVLVGACSTASNSPGQGNSVAGGGSVAPGSSAAAGATVAAAMKEWSITLDPATGTAGALTFNIANNGSFTHEFIVVKTDLADDKLPTKADGSVDQSDPQLTAVDEKEDIAAGSTDNTLAVTLTPGQYVVFCNLVVSGTSHYAQGLHTSFTVN
ncbi:MAG: hypothetical protein H0W81_12190 [Chloroflexi bacterium]|nr:hypothetical protein [Chloroflexota bacterium]